MPCRIEFSAIELNLQIGCTDEERARPQPIRLRAVVSSPEFFPASASDQLSDTLDAAEVRALLVSTATETEPVSTLERLGEILKARMLAQFQVRGLGWEIAIEKPQFGWTYVLAWTS